MLSDSRSNRPKARAISANVTLIGPHKGRLKRIHMGKGGRRLCTFPNRRHSTYCNQSRWEAALHVQRPCVTYPRALGSPDPTCLLVFGSLPALIFFTLRLVVDVENEQDYIVLMHDKSPAIIASTGEVFSVARRPCASGWRLDVTCVSAAQHTCGTQKTSPPHTRLAIWSGPEAFF